MKIGCIRLLNILSVKKERYSFGYRASVIIMVLWKIIEYVLYQSCGAVNYPIKFTLIYNFKPGFFRTLEADNTAFIKKIGLSAWVVVWKSYFGR